MNFVGPAGLSSHAEKTQNQYSLWFMHRLTRLVGLSQLGRCPHLTVTLLAQLAHMLQGALSAQMFILQIRIH